MIHFGESSVCFFMPCNTYFMTLKTALKLCVLLPISAAAGTPFDGLSGREILAVIYRDYRPTSYVTSTMGSDGAWATVYSYATGTDGSLTDYFSDSHSYRPSYPPPPSDLYLTNIVPAAWWGDTYGDRPTQDLHNVVTANGNVESHKGTLSPGIVTAKDYDGGTWATGRGSYLGRTAPMYTPPAGREGDFARAMMYCCAVYPMELWQSNGFYIFADGTYPLLTDYGRELLLKWHREDGVDDFERERNRVIAEQQGNVNPFVSYPELAELVWGDGTTETPSETEPNESGSTDSSNPDLNNSDSNSDSETAAECIGIRDYYSQTADTLIYLYSPYIESDATWYVDGKQAVVEAIPTASLTVGQHTITYRTSTRCGVIIIYVTE
jgi:hypothetical protein